MNHSILRGFILIILLVITNPPGNSQSDMPDILKQGKLPEQLNYIEERTRIYEYYRAIREDMFQQIKQNILDTLRASDAMISDLTSAKTSLNLKIDSLNKLVADARSKLDDAVRTKNNIKVLGMNVNKHLYNSVMWIIVAGLAALLVMGFLAFRTNLTATGSTKKDLEDLKNEFEAYRKQSREAREKMSMDHFNEIRRLRAKVEEQRDEIPGSGSAERRAQGSGQRLRSEAANQPEGELSEAKSREKIGRAHV